MRNVNGGKGIGDLSLDPKKAIAVFERQPLKRLPVGSRRWGMCSSRAGALCAAVGSVSGCISGFG